MMFKFFKDKLKSAIDRFSKNVDKESEDAKPEEALEELKQEKAESVKELQQEEKLQEENPEEEIIDEPEPEEDINEEAEPEEEKKAEEEEKPIEAEEEEPEEEETHHEEGKAEEEIIDEPEPEEEGKAGQEEKAEEKEEPETANAEELYEEKIQEIIGTPKKAAKEEVRAKTHVIEKEAEPKKKGIFARIKDRVTQKEEKPGPAEPNKVIPSTSEPEQRQSLLKKVTDSVTKKSISESKFNDLFWELEIVLLENNVAVDVIEKIKEDLRAELVTKKIRIGKTHEVILQALTRSIDSLFNAEKISLMDELRKKKPYVILFVGVNGVGKTTTIAKVAHMLQKNKKSCVIAAADTFRAAAIQQLEEHAKRLGTKLIKHDYGSDPAAVAFDAIKYAKSKDIDVVLVDTAGRQHSNTNLMEEMKKMGRVASPDLKLFVGESITGNDCIVQASKFNEAVGIDGIILSKADVDDKGGAAISVSYVTKKPILYLGTGQDYGALQEFDKDIIIRNLGLA